ncbi:hypothetical protein GECvBN6_gp203 [Salmonella phage GEC_vB_N6]|nr:hypothetical protein GECvBN6_gp203 [Salmonella phage GEC_vB_N6]
MIGHNKFILLWVVLWIGLIKRFKGRYRARDSKPPLWYYPQQYELRGDSLRDSCPDSESPERTAGGQSSR